MGSNKAWWDRRARRKGKASQGAAAGQGGVAASGKAKAAPTPGKLAAASIRRPHVVRRRAFVAGSGALVAAAAVGTGVAARYASMLDRIVNPTSTDATDEERKATTSEAERLAERVELEGAVLLRNEPVNVPRGSASGAASADGEPGVAPADGAPATSDASAPAELTLPIPATTRKVNVFGWASTAWLGGGSGSGGIKSCDLTFLAALEAYGIEYNARLTAMYESFQAEREFTATLHSWPEESARLYEPDIEDEASYSQELLREALAYSDTAIVVIGRLAGESSDLPEVQYRRTQKGGAIRRDLARHTLALSREEERLLTYVGARYARVVVVVNTGNVMELGPIETIPGIGACLLAGYSGQRAASVLPKLLWGEASPSGRTTDTWAYSLRTAASYANSGKQGVGAYEGAEGLYPADGTTCGNLGVPYAYEQVSYVDYAEGPYVGYRWYQTADAEGYWSDVSNEYGDGYAGVVQYPFGYGLSYTTFSWEVTDRPQPGLYLDLVDHLEFKVRVTNTGTRAGADVVELYAEVPYVRGQVEKPSVALVAYARTSELEPGASEEVALSLDVYDLASYDAADASGDGFRGFELDAGAYVFSLRHDAHTPDAGERAVTKCLLAKARQFPNDPATGAEVRNRFSGEDAADGVGIDGADSGQGVSYLSRADFASTFPWRNVDARPIPEAVAALNLFTADDADAWSSGDAVEGYASGVPDPVRMGGLGTQRAEFRGELTQLGRALGEDYGDSRWDSLLDQLKPSEAVRLVCDAYSGTAEVASVGKEATRDADGPAQIGGFTGFSVGTGFPCPWVLAQAWDAELAREVGRMIGRQCGQLGYGGWYAPAANLHRSPVGGRNYEYCSEDPLVAGEVCGNMVAGAREAGIFSYVKHLICNDGEAYIYRDGLYTWMTEQTLREVYLRPFRRLVVTYGATAMMSSYNRLGAVWAGGSRALLTNVLRGEWGFHGAVITDYSDHPAYMNGTQALAAGGDLWMAGTELTGDDSTQVFRTELRRVAKDVLFMQLDARVANERYVERTGDVSALKPKVTGALPLWPIAVAAIDVVAVGLLALSIRYALRDRREDGSRGGGEARR